jgi:hypothetical protein
MEALDRHCAREAGLPVKAREVHRRHAACGYLVVQRIFVDGSARGILGRAHPINYAMRRVLFLGALAGCRAVLGVPDVSEIADDASVGDAQPSDARADVGQQGADAATEGGNVDATGWAADFKTDRANCGRCGHDCLGGDCSDGVCQPVTLAQNEMQLGAIAVEGTTAYWVAGSDVHKCAVSGCGGVPTTVGSSTQRVSGLAVVSGHVAWLTGEVLFTGDVYACSTDGCGGSPLKLGTGTSNSNPTSIAADTNVVYWSNEEAKGTIVSAPWGGGPTSVFAGARTYPTKLAVDATSVYWVEDTSTSYQIIACPLGTCAGGPRVVTTDMGVSVLTSNGKSLVWQSNSGIAACDLPACASPKILSPVGPSTPALALDDAFVYWVDGSGLLKECALAGCGGNATSLASGQTGVYGITTDALAVYWTSAGRVLKVAKP